MMFRRIVLVAMLFLLGGCGSDAAPPEALPLRGWDGELVGDSTTTTSTTAAPSTTITIADSAAPTESGRVGPSKGTDEEALRRANAGLLTAASNRESILPWFSTNCRAAMSLVADDDPLSSILAEQSLLDAQLEVVDVEVDGATAIITLDDEYRIENPWVLDDETWRWGDCVAVEVADDLTATGQPDEAGLDARLAQISRLVTAEKVGKYGWLSQRCRHDSVDQLRDYPGLIGVRRDHFSNLETWWTFDDLAVLYIDPNGFAMASRLDATSPTLFEGEPASRWVFEHGNWYYDGCLEFDEQALEVSPDGSPKVVRTIEGVHHQLVNNPIDVAGLTRASEGMDEYNGYRITYEIDDPTTREAANALFKSELLPALVAAGYSADSPGEGSATFTLAGDGCAWGSARVAWQIPSSPNPHVIHVDLALQC